MPTKTAATGEMDASDSTRLVAVRDRRTGRLRVLPVAHVVSGGSIDSAKSRSANPTTDKSCGILRPSSAAAR